MRTAEQIYALLVEANPVPDPEASLESATQARPALHLVDPRRPVMQAQHDGKQRETQVTKPKPRRYSWVYAAAAFALVVMIGAVTALVLRSGGDSDDVIANIDATPTTTVAQPETATTATVSSTTLSEAAAIATAGAFQDALNAHDSDAAAALFAGSGVWVWLPPGSPGWEEAFAENEAWGHHGTLSDCAVTDGVVTCLQTWENANLGGKAGITWQTEWEVRFDDQGLITNLNYGSSTGEDEETAFGNALGAWMATAYPDAYETFFLYEGYWNRENWLIRINELSPLIDEFIAQSDDYPLDS